MERTGPRATTRSEALRLTKKWLPDAISPERVYLGLPVINPPKKEPNPSTRSQWGQEYMTSFLMNP